MQRTFNYTGRKKIPRSEVSVRIHSVNGQAPTFDAKFDLSKIKLPGHAKVYVEAYHRASYMRFHYGCVSEIRPPQDRTLADIEGGGTAQFRLKVIDESTEHGQVLAEADGVTPIESDDAHANHRSILPVVVCELGDQIWRVVFDSGDGRPVLELNKSVDGIGQLAKTDNSFLALVYPAVVRLVLDQILRGRDRVREVDGPADDWRYQWLQFARTLPGIVDPPMSTEDDDEDEILEDQQRAWIDDVVASFCSHCRALDRFNQMINPGEC